MTPIVDADVRRRAVMTSGHAFVWASAGTGKTHTLTLRALYLLLHEAEPDLYRAADRRDRLGAAGRVLGSVALTTFTRKAAAEMRHRLFSYLDGVSTGQSAADSGLPADPLIDEILDAVRQRFRCDDEQLRRGAAALGERAAELQVATLHSFAAALLRRHPLAAGLPPGVHFAREDEDDLLDINELLVERWWRSHALSDPATQQLLSPVLEVLDTAQLRQWLDMALRHDWLADETALPVPDPDDVASAQAALGRMAATLSEASSSKMPRVGDELASILARLDSDPESGWPALQSFCARQRGYLFRCSRLTKTVARLLDSFDEDAARWFEDTAALESLAAAEWIHRCRTDVWENWRGLLADFHNWAATAAVSELGLVTFDETIDRSVRLLESRPDVRRRESGRYKALLVDEFQDTDPRQLRLLELLLLTDEEPTLGFFVGDLKQSIYRFRGADVDAIRHFHRRFREQASRPCADFQLQATFRTAPPVARFANRFFSEVVGLASAAEQLEPVRETAAGRARWWRLETVDGGKLTKFRARQEAALRTVEVIQSSCPENYRYSDVLVLTRDYRELNALLPELQATGIPTISSGAHTFYSQPEVLDVLNLLIALHTPQDGLSVAALLRSPMVQLADDQIHSLLEAIPPESLLFADAALPDWLEPPVLRRLGELRRLRAERPLLPVDEWLHEVSGFIPRTVYVARHDREGRALVRINRVLEEFQRFVLTDQAPLEWLIRQRRRSASGGPFQADLGEDVSLSDETLDGVRVMTIHKAKGLEARLVVVYGWSSVLDSADIRRSRPVVSARGPDGREVRGFSLPWGPVRISSAGYADACARDAEGEVEEAARLGYVAVTRARDEVVLLNPVWSGWKTGPGVEQLLSGEESAGAGGWFELETDRAAESGGRQPTGQAVQLDRAGYRRHWDTLFERFHQAPGGLFNPSDESDPGIVARVSGAGETGLEVGRLVHRYLEEHLLDAWSAERLQSTPGLEGTAPEAVERSRQLLERFYAGRTLDGAGVPCRRRLERAEVLGREVPLLLSHEGRLWSGAVDLVLREGDRVTAVDYKTTPPPEPLPAAYIRQRQIYREGLRRIFPEQTVDFEFWWLGAAERPRERPDPVQTQLPFGEEGEEGSDLGN